MTTPERTQVASHVAAIILCGVLAVCAVTIAHSVNRTMIAVQKPLADVHNAMLPVPGAIQQLQGVTKAATGLLEAAKPVVASLQTSIDLTTHRLDDLCPTGTVDAEIHPCGTLADTNRTLATLRGTSGQVEQSMLMFNSHETNLFAQEHDAYGAMQKSVVDFDTMVSDPNIPAMFANGRSITGDAAGITHDGHIWLHQKLFPTKKKGVLSGFEATGDAVHHWLPPLF